MSTANKLPHITLLSWGDRQFSKMRTVQDFAGHTTRATGLGVRRGLCLSMSPRLDPRRRLGKWRRTQASAVPACHRPGGVVW